MELKCFESVLLIGKLIKDKTRIRDMDPISVLRNEKVVGKGLRSCGVYPSDTYF